MKATVIKFHVSLIALMKFFLTEQRLGVSAPGLNISEICICNF